MSLQKPVRVDISQAPTKVTSPAEAQSSRVSDPELSTESCSGASLSSEVAMPENLQHHYMVVPQKLRLVTLAAFLLWKCKVHLSCKKV